MDGVFVLVSPLRRLLKEDGKADLLVFFLIVKTSIPWRVDVLLHCILVIQILHTEIVNPLEKIGQMPFDYRILLRSENDVACRVSLSATFFELCFRAIPNF